MTIERDIRAVGGWLMLGILIAAAFGSGWIIYGSVRGQVVESPWQLTGGVLLSLLVTFLCCGFFTLQPNVSAVLLLFGKYKGTVKVSGFHWANPLMTKKKVSLRAHNLNGEKLKVNDKRGNPIEIAAVVVWRVHNTAEASFDVEDYEAYVTVQSESAVRHLATKYPYDTGEYEELSLRGSIDEVSRGLQNELGERLGKAGVVVDEARLSHLAYAPEIAGAMLQRQQAEAIVAARQRLVDGAVGMVEMALDKLEEHKTVKLDEERKAVMVSNLLVVLCGDKATQPIVNAGTLY
ncbi:MAG: SPFH domain-containing protein [Phycisphaerae bacterium]